MFSVVKQNTDFDVSKWGSSDVFYAIDTSINSVDATLPPAEFGVGRVITFKVVVGGNNFTVVTDGSELIDGYTGPWAGVPYATMTIISDGTRWSVLKNNGFADPD